MPFLRDAMDRASLPALADEITRSLVEVAALLKSTAVRRDEAADAAAIAPLAEAMRLLSEVRGALLMIDEQGLAALVQLLRALVPAENRQDSARSERRADELALIAQWFQSMMRSELNGLLRGHRPSAGQLLRHWQPLVAAVASGNAVDRYPAALVSLHVEDEVIASLPPMPEPDPKPVEFDSALLAFLRARDDAQRSDAAHRIVDALAQACANAVDVDERARWLALRAYLIEFAAAGGDAVRAKRIVAATARALRHVGQAGEMLASLAREALFDLAQRDLRSDQAREVARLFQLDRQFAPCVAKDVESIMVDASCAASASAFADVIAATVAAIEAEPDKLVEPEIWMTLSTAAEFCAPASAIADSLRQMAVRLAEGTADNREWLAAALLCLQSGVGAHGFASDDIAGIAEALRETDPSRRLGLMRRWMQANGAHRLSLDLCSALRSEMAAAERALDATDVGEDARRNAIGTLTRIAGVLQLLALEGERDAVLVLRAQLQEAEEFVAGPDDALAQQWVRLQESFALLPWRLRDSGTVPVDADIDNEAALLAVKADVGLDAIFIAEAGSLLGELRELAVVSEPAALAHVAHTLAGCSATLGLTGIAELAHAMEDALAGGPKADPALLAETLDAFDAMLAEFTATGWCGVASQLAQRWRMNERAMPLAEASETCLQIDAEGSEVPIAELVSASPPEIVSGQVGDVMSEVSGLEGPESLALAVGLLITSPSQQEVVVSEIEDDALDDESELLALFNEEAADLLPQIEQAVRAWQRQPDDREQAARLLRVLHTLKGSARMAGQHDLGEDFHRAETEIGALSQLAPSAVAAQLPALLERVDQWLRSMSVGPVMPVMPADEAPAIADEVVAQQQAPAQLTSSPLLRVRADQLAQFADSSAEIWTGNARIREGLQEQRRSVADLSDDIARLRAQLRELEIEAESRILSRATQESSSEFDPLEFDRYTRLHELTRMMAESITDIAGVQRGLTRQVEALGSAASAQARDLRRLQSELQVLRSQPLRTVEARLRHLLRQSARETGREAELVIEGGMIEIERGMLDRVMAPLEHLLRNAVVHGIELPDQREKCGKPRAGKVTISAALAGNELRLTVSDDGAGLDVERIRARALAVGLLQASDLVDARALAALIFEPGFSTASEITALSGRGIGMDAVRVGLQALGGRIDIDSEPGQGCRFSIRLPASLASVQVILATAGRSRIALPASLLQQVLQLDPDRNRGEIRHNDDGCQIHWQGAAIRLLHLGSALGDAAVSSDSARVPVAVLRDGEQMLAVQLDAIEGQREVIVKHPGAQLAQVPGLAGATLLADGGIALIIDPFRLPAIAPVVLPAVDPKRAPLVLVADDSLTVRRASQRLLERHGYAVALARDGVEALEQLQRQRPAVMLLDIEMPRMDGFELLAALRDDARYRALPVVMITSRIAERHRERATRLGATAYMGKPYDEDALLGLLSTLCVTEAAVA